MSAMADYNELVRVIKLAMGENTGSWLAEKSGVSQPTISRLLNGVGSSSARNIKAVARALRLNPNELLVLAGIADDEEDDDTTLDPSARYIARRLTRLPISVREAAIDAVSGVVDGFSQVAEDDSPKEPSKVVDLAIFPEEDQELISHLAPVFQEYLAALKKQGKGRYTEAMEFARTQADAEMRRLSRRQPRPE